MQLSCLPPAEFSRPVSALCGNQDGLSQRSVSEHPHLHSPSGDEQDTELEPSLDQDQDQDQDHDQEEDEDQTEDQEEDEDRPTTPSKKKDVKVLLGRWEGWDRGRHFHDGGTYPKNPCLD